MENVNLEIGPCTSRECKDIIMKGPGDFGLRMSTVLRPKDSKYPNFSVGTVDIYLPSEIFDKIIDMLGEEYLRHIKKDVTDSIILKVDDKITLVKEEGRIRKIYPVMIEEKEEKIDDKEEKDILSDIPSEFIDF